jgi:hypothetical protein
VVIGDLGGVGGRQGLRDPRRSIIVTLLERPGFNSELAHRFLDHALNREADWVSRCIAVLAVEHQLLLLDPAAADAFMPFLARLDFTPAPNASCRTDVLKQGYTTVDPRAFVVELTRRLSRLAPVHESLRRAHVEPEAIANFEHVASQECLLTLARAAFSPVEVISRVLSQVSLTAAQRETPGADPHFEEEARIAADQLPEYEADILARLLGMVRSWWVRPATPSRLNALIEYPVGTAALVIRPPGSSTEFEIKRVGLRSAQPLNVVFERRGEQVSPSHRLQGGASLAILQWEASNSALLSGLFRSIHGESAPISRMVQLRSIKAVPRADGSEVPVLTWFEDPAAFGDGFVEMRRAMVRSVSAFVDETTVLPSMPRSFEARTRAFLECLTPAQCTLIGTSVLRLDKASEGLRSGGPESYFKAAHSRTPTPGEAYRFADSILLEILGTYRPPAATGSYAGYVAAAFADPENRAAADRSFRAAVASMGRLWGTLLGVRGFTEGESFVPRNVGLRSAWTGGAWSVQIVFMDHELTNIIGKRMRYFHPRAALPGMHKDWVHIFGGELGGRLWPGCLAVLTDIYRIDAAVAAEGRAHLIKEILRAYRIALERLRDDAKVRAHFRRSFLDPLLAWDAVVGLYRASRVGARQRSQWKGRMRQVMSAHGLDEPLIHEYRRAIQRHRHMLRRCPYLFDAGGGA